MNGGVTSARPSWFKRYEGKWVVLWRVPEGHFPEVLDGWKRLTHLRRYGDPPYAFTFGRPFPPHPLPPEIEPAGISSEVSFRVAAKRSWLPWFLNW